MLGINRSIFRRLLFSHLSILLLGLVTVGLATAWLVKGFIYETRRDQLQRQGRQVNLTLLDAPAARDPELTALLAFLDKSFDARIWLFDPSGQIVATSAEEEVYVGKSVAPAVVSKVLQGQDVVEPLAFPGLQQPVLSVVVPWGKKDLLKGGVILHAPVEGVDRTIARVRETLLWTTLIAVLLSSSAGSYLSWTISRPLKDIEKVATEIGAGQYERRVAGHFPDEIGDLAVAINAMAAKLAAVETERRSLEQAREELFANVSHELRAPLTAVLGFLEALQDGVAENRAQEELYLEVTYREALHLKRLVDDLLDLTRLTAGRVELQRVPVDAAALVEQVCTEMAPAASARGNTLRLEPPGGALPKVAADPVRLRQILINLVENAAKFTENGAITLGLGAGGTGVEIRVTDTGIGIAPAELPLIWERFYKVDRPRTRNRSGTGLGLAIVRQLVDLHGGQIAVESQVGRGTTFTLWLPPWPAA